MTSLPGVLSALVPAFCLDGAPPWADMPLLQDPVCETDRGAFCPVFSGSSESPEETPFHLPPPSPWLAKSSSVCFSSSGLSQGSSVADRFSESVFSYAENRTEKLCAETSTKCELGSGKYFQITGLKKKEQQWFVLQKNSKDSSIFIFVFICFVHFSPIILTCTY